MSGIDFKSFLIGVLITIIFVFTTGVTTQGDGRYMVSCKQSHCLVLNTETGAGRYVHENARLSLPGFSTIQIEGECLLCPCIYI